MAFGDDTLEEALFGNKDVTPHHIPSNTHEENKFFMIWVEGGHAPTKKHETWRKASQEAERLSRLDVGKKVYILTTCEVLVSTISTGRTTIG